jgi:uncharacterized oxidoreductase
MIAEGKIKVALNKGIPVPDGCLLDPEGRPTNDPKIFYGPPPGAILPFGGHKGFGLGIIAEVLAGALTGNGCSNPGHADRLTNGMLAILIDPACFQTSEAFNAEIQRFISYVKGSAKASADGEILMPGEIEERNRKRRLRDGIELDDATWGQIQETCQSLHVAEV